MTCLICCADWFIFDLPLVQPLKRSPQIRGPTICRSRRPATIPQPAAAMISPEPDLLIPTRASYPCEEGGMFLKTLKKQYVFLPIQRPICFYTLLMLKRFLSVFVHSLIPFLVLFLALFFPYSSFDFSH